MTTPEGDFIRQLAIEQQAVQSQQQAMGTGLLGGAMGGMFAFGTDPVQQYETTTTTTDDYSLAYLPTPWKQGTRDYGVVNFYRINEARNDKMSSEPLDELRIKVAKWLN